MKIPLKKSIHWDKRLTIDCRVCYQPFEKLESEGVSVCYECYKNFACKDCPHDATPTFTDKDLVTL